MHPQKCNECALDGHYEVTIDIKHPDDTHVKVTVRLCERCLRKIPVYEAFRKRKEAIQRKLEDSQRPRSGARREDSQARIRYNERHSAWFTQFKERG